MEKIREVVVLTGLLALVGCASTGEPLPEEYRWHSKDYPCPPGTVNVNRNSVLKDSWVCEKGAIYIPYIFR